MSAGEDARVAHHRVEVVVDLEGARALRQPVLVEVLQVVVRDRVAAKRIAFNYWVALRLVGRVFVCLLLELAS